MEQQSPRTAREAANTRFSGGVYGWLRQNGRLTLLILVGLFVLYEVLTNCSWFGCPAGGSRFNPFSP